LATLYIVATPIGNLEDITLRAIRVLREVDLIACEDTRQTRKLLEHFDIRKPLISYQEHNEQQRTSELLARLEAGESIALVTDAGTPLVSDPGFRLVRGAAGAGISVVPIPGPSAALAALSASGLPTDQFRFCAFLPAKASQRRAAIQALAGESATLVFYEAPHRILDALEDIEGVLGSRDVVVGRELTKMHEEFLRGTAAEVLQRLRERPVVKGEITLLIGKGAGPAAPAESVEESLARLEAAGVSRMEAIKRVARERGMSKRQVYALVHSRA
jgi:16S rRNA (cytidine1402-2'-O)-methyltransferase